MRAYFFGNHYISSIQHGIQAAHCISDMHRIYDTDSSILNEWADNHKTMILLDGGYLETMQELSFFLQSPENNYPFAEFNESGAALGGVLTSIGIILPEKIYLVSSEIRKNPGGVVDTEIKNNGMLTVAPDNYLGFNVDKNTTFYYSKWEYELIKRLNTFSLAR